MNKEVILVKLSFTQNLNFSLHTYIIKINVILTHLLKIIMYTYDTIFKIKKYKID